MKFRFLEKRNNSTLPLAQLLQDLFLEIEISEAVLIENLKVVWKSATDAILASHSEPVRMVRNTLYVWVDHSIYANELMLMKNAILDKIHNEAGLTAVEDIRIETGKRKRNVQV